MICRSLASRPPHGVSNQSAYRLYERYGFNEVGRRRDYYTAAGGCEDALVMVCPLFD